MFLFRFGDFNVMQSQPPWCRVQLRQVVHKHVPYLWHVTSVMGSCQFSASDTLPLWSGTGHTDGQTDNGHQRIMPCTLWRRGIITGSHVLHWLSAKSNMFTSVEKWIDGSFEQYTAPQNCLYLPETSRLQPQQTHCHIRHRNSRIITTACH